jgi:hypothetical protein
VEAWRRHKNNTRGEEMEKVRTRELVKYQPKLDGKKWITRTTQGGGNGGLHNQEEFRKGVEMLEWCAHSFRNPRLFHVCFTGAPVAVYRLVIRRFCRGLKMQGIRYRWKAAIEHDSAKGLHMHLMIVLEGGSHQTHRFITSSDEYGKLENVSLLRKAVQHTFSDCSHLRYRVNPPQSRRPLAFIQFNQTNAEFFEDAAEWLSYIYKARSKPETGTVYFADRQGGGRACTRREGRRRRSVGPSYRV